MSFPRNVLFPAVLVLCLGGLSAPPAGADNQSGAVKKVVEKCTLDQDGTKPFHLKANFAPAYDRDAASHHEGEVEIWWESPTRWRREVRSPDFHQVEIVDGDRTWQKNDGDFFPEWLRELAVALVRPVPLPMDLLLRNVKAAEVHHEFRQTQIEWGPVSDQGDAETNGGGSITLDDQSGMLAYAFGSGWSGEYHDFKDFHGRTVARTITTGEIQVTAKIVTLEDLGSVPDGFFDANAPGSDAQPIETIVLSERELRANLQPGSQSFAWPPAENGPFEGTVWMEVVIDRTGKVREETMSPIANNPAMSGAARKGFWAMQFKPFMSNGVPVQATGRLTVAFKTARPVAMEAFDSALNYFEHGRKSSFLAAGASAPYELHAEFQVGIHGSIQSGRYEDTWISDMQWKREAWIGSSHVVRSQSGDKYYRLSEGADSHVLDLVMLFMEPIPAGDTMTESDWSISRDAAYGVTAVRVSRGTEDQKGELHADKSQAYWFDESGHLLKSYVSGLEVRPMDVEPFDGLRIARRIDVLNNGQMPMEISIKDIGPPATVDPKQFKLKGHEWQRAFTAEVR